ncbi:hypothetical protein BK133_08670 [Paenibacillus sp. FSL H8-0548]|uniref:hypothetical protein n=1 Tax=Paenibacillus sp. FSL H8-0548 TaxID=1920422 RepID=UPI00096C0166|nr:hypothetical protein [Paenibacillus sp. FSL H8-0548]OMF36709.1 hypothetical protein BK133_08670 [Paenibacillus sp. FSL H8-0548]
MKTKHGYILLAVLSLILILFVLNWIRINTDNFGYFQSFSVTINNQSDYDIVSVETGIVAGTSKHIYDKQIKAGDSARIKPKLSLVGEGAVYLKYTDSRGDVTETSACGYTESLSGRIKLTITNDGVIENEQKCL